MTAKKKELSLEEVLKPSKHVANAMLFINNKNIPLTSDYCIKFERYGPDNKVIPILYENGEELTGNVQLTLSIGRL